MKYSHECKGIYRDLVEELINRNHHVTVVHCSDRTSEKSLYKIKDNLRSLDVNTPNMFANNLIKKGINQILLPFYFKKAIKKNLSNETYDLILYATPPITLVNVIKYCKNKYTAKTFLMLKDIFPQNAVDLKMMSKKGIIYKYFRKQEEKYYDVSDYIGCMSKKNAEYIQKNNPCIDVSKLHIFPNSIEIEEISSRFNQDKTIFVFGGNLGKPQNIPFILEIIKNLEDYNKAEFWIIGDGTERYVVEEFIKNNDKCNLKYMGHVSPQEYEEILCNADVGIISLDPRFTIPNVPSRFQGYLKLKKPVLAVTDKNTDIKEMIRDNDCGWWFEARDASYIANSIKNICTEKESQIQKGKNGYEFLIKEFDVKKNVDDIEDFVIN